MTLPVTADDLHQIRTIAEMFTSRVVTVQPCPAGSLLQCVDADDSVIPAALTAAGYTVTRVERDLLLVSGVVDRAELLEAEIARLTEHRDRVRTTDTEG